MNKIKVAIIDDHKVVVEGIEKLINNSEVAMVIGTAYSAVEGLKMLEKITPDVLLLDVGLPDGNGMELCPKIKEKYLTINILMLTSYSEYTIISHVLNNGASGYLLKSASSEEFIAGIKAVFTGKRFLCEEVQQIMKQQNNNPIILTRKETTLLKYLTDGLTSQEISEKMCLGYETIRSYRKNLLLKFEVNSTVELIRLATKMGFC